PQLVVIENVRGILSAPAHSDMEPCPWCLGDDGAKSAVRALGAVIGDLATLGYDARWCGVRASDAGAPHQRFRIFVAAADAERGGVQRRRGRRELVGAPRSAQSEGRKGVYDAFGGGSAAADTEHEQREGIWSVSGLGWRSDTRSDLSDLQSDSAAANTASPARRGTEPEHLGTRPQPAPEPPERAGSDIDWREYEPAI